jgi:hypothetical protein
MKLNHCLLLLLMFTGLLSLPIAHAQVLASWELSGLSGITAGPVNATALGANVTSATLSRNSGGLTASAATGAFGAVSWTSGGDAPSAFAANNFYIIEITIDPGYKATYSSVQAALQRSTLGPTSTELRSNKTGSSSLGNNTVTTTSALYTYNSGFAPNLSNVTGTVQFYLAGWNSTGDTEPLDVGNFAGNDLIINGSTALPVSLIDFNADKTEDEQVLIQFKTVSETNNAYFDVERSADGSRYEPIGRVDGAGTSAVVQKYAFTDPKPLLGINYYRLRQVDFDGQFAFSPVATAFVGTVARLYLVPNPVSEEATVIYPGGFSETSTWHVYDQSGRLVLEGAIDAETNVFGFHVGHLPKQRYVLRVTSGQQVMTQWFMVK